MSTHLYRLAVMAQPQLEPGERVVVAARAELIAVRPDAQCAISLIERCERALRARGGGTSVSGSDKGGMPVLVVITERRLVLFELTSPTGRIGARLGAVGRAETRIDARDAPSATVLEVTGAAGDTCAELHLIGTERDPW